MTNDQAAPQHKTEWHVIVNGRRREVDGPTQSYADIVKLALGSVPSGDGVRITVTYHNADQEPRNSTLMDGQTVQVRHDGTSFDVHQTNRS
jgi:hypothetical protein